jgi:hypothetical protein
VTTGRAFAGQRCCSQELAKAVLGFVDGIDAG